MKPYIKQKTEIFTQPNFNLEKNISQDIKKNKNQPEMKLNAKTVIKKTNVNNR